MTTTFEEELAAKELQYEIGTLSEFQYKLGQERIARKHKKEIAEADQEKIAEAKKKLRQKYGFDEEPAKKDNDAVKTDAAERKKPTMEKNKNKENGRDNYTEKEMLDLIISFTQMIFQGKLKGFEVKTAANGKIKISIK